MLEEPSLPLNPEKIQELREQMKEQIRLFPDDS